MRLHILGIGGTFMGGVVVVESVFVYPGIGDTMVSAVSNRDIPVVQACALIF